MKNGDLYVANLCTLIPLATKEADLKAKKLQMFPCAVSSWIWTLHHPHTVTLGQTICGLFTVAYSVWKREEDVQTKHKHHNTIQINKKIKNVINQCMLHLGRDVGETSKRWSGAHMRFSKCIDTILSWTELNWTFGREFHTNFQITEKY